MPFIAIIAKENDSNFIRKCIEKNIKKDNIVVINVDEKNVENIKNVKFDVVVINEKIEEFLEKSNYIHKIINTCKYLLINSDVVKEYKFLTNINLITYGLNKNANFTISSINDSNILVCLQKSIKMQNDKILEEQEFNIIIKKGNLKKVHNMLPIFIILSIYGIFLKKI